MTSLSRISILHRRIPRRFLVAATAWSYGAINAVVTLVCVRLLLDYLGHESYAAYSVLIGLSRWFQSADFGIGFSLQNFISELRVQNRSYHHFVVSGGAFLFLVTIAGAISLVILSPALSSYLLQSSPSLSPRERALAFVATTLALLFASFGSLAYRTWYGRQRGYWAHIFPTAGLLVGFTSVYLVASHVDSYRLVWTVAAFHAPTAGFAVIAVAIVVARSYRRGGRLRRDVLAPLLRRAAGFWTFSLLAAGVLGVDYLIISQIFPAEEIVVYSVSMRIMSFGLFIYSSVLSATWPILTEAAARKDAAHIRRLLQGNLCGGFIFMFVFSTAIILFKDEILLVLAPSVRTLTTSAFLLALAVYFLFRIWTDAFANFLMSINAFSYFFIFVPIQAILSLVLQASLGSYFGLPGLVCGLILSYLLTVAWGLPLAFRLETQRWQGAAQYQDVDLHSDV